KSIATCLLPLVSICFAILCGEAVFRVYYWTKDGIPAREWHRFFLGNFDGTMLDETLGWKATENYRANRAEKTKQGKSYVVTLSQNRYGFRQFGEIGSDKFKILILGDSFTHAREVSDSKTYYALLGRERPYEVFAYGVENYGTLQEYMILDRFFDLIKPDLLVWQYCYNDFANNDPLMERRTMLHIDFRQRPYWSKGEIIRDMPSSILGKFRGLAYKYSRFIVFLLSRMDRLYAAYLLDSVEAEILRSGAQHPDFRRAVRTTDELMATVRARVGATPVVAFNCKAVEPYNAALKNISGRHDIIFLDEIAEAVDFAARQGRDVFHADGAHWSEEGHKLVGEMLVKRLEEFRVNRSLYRYREAAAPPN
ncbi:MAG TPA: SGNH/GDSL hydrolase family protein, partial [Nitrospira sp.]|nr:SGNH/GDSL hydrolase family protein [Nitrospira sp.]